MDFDGSLPLEDNANGELFGGTDLDDISEVPSASVASSVAARDLEISVGEQATGSRIDFGHVVGAAWDSLSPEHAEPIWNSGFWRCIFGTDSLGDALSQQFKRPLPVSDLVNEETVEQDKRQKTAVTFTADGPLFQSCVKSTDDIAWQEKREALLQKALKHWLVLALSWCDSLDFVVCLKGCNSTNAQLIMLGDVFRGKAPSTLNKRAGSMKLLCQMSSEKNLVFPCNESQLYGVLCELRSGGAPPSRGKGILEAVAFVRYTMGVTECDELLRGRRCWGAATSDAPLQRTQASPLLVTELERLHNVLESDEDSWNRLFSGTLLFMIYARARWSDAQHAVKITFDRADGEIHYVEVLTGHHKTMRALQHRHQFLPLIAPAVGVTGKNWAVLWEKVRDDMGLNMLKGQPLLPAPLDNDELGRRALDSQEAGKWLRALLGLSGAALGDRKVSSHSLKCTMLSYLAKRGVEMSDRLLLGYHTSLFTMGLTYSRDGMARPLQILQAMLEEIHSGQFRPDCTRSGRLVKVSSEPQSKVQELSCANVVKIESSDDERLLSAWDLVDSDKLPSLPKVIPVDSDHDLNDACTETSSSEMSCDAQSVPAFESKGTRTFEPPAAPEGYEMWQHTKSKILHLVHFKTPNVFECGRRPGAFHTNRNVNPRWDTGICWKCFKHK